VQRQVLTELEQQVDMLLVFEDVLKARDVLVLELAVDLDLLDQLFLRTASLQLDLLDDLCREPLARLQVRDLSDVREPALAQRFAQHILDRLHRPVLLHHLLHDDVPLPDK